MKQEIVIKTFSGDEMKTYADDIAQLRIEVFREYPYLYDGAVQYEKEYLKPYFAAKRSAFIIAFEGKKIVGASTCIHLPEEASVFQKPFLEKGEDLERAFYFGESVLRKAYRGRGIGVEFFKQREAFSFSFPDIIKTTFCAVERPADHPMKPAGYQPLHEFWKRRGYSRRDDLIAYLGWKDINEEKASPKKMVFWEKLR